MTALEECVPGKTRLDQHPTRAWIVQRNDRIELAKAEAIESVRDEGPCDLRGVSMPPVPPPEQITDFPGSTGADDELTGAHESAGSARDDRELDRTVILRGTPLFSCGSRGQRSRLIPVGCPHGGVVNESLHLLPIAGKERAEHQTLRVDRRDRQRFGLVRCRHGRPTTLPGFMRLCGSSMRLHCRIKSSAMGSS